MTLHPYTYATFLGVLCGTSIIVVQQLLELDRNFALFWAMFLAIKALRCFRDLWEMTRGT